MNMMATGQTIRAKDGLEITTEHTFNTRTAVRWYNPRQLLLVGVQAVASAISRKYVDKREILWGTPDTSPPDQPFENGDDIWFDFVADTGDGWNTTYGIAYLLAQNSLRFPLDDGELELKRGKLLVMGGDEVYPVASEREYRDRLLGPYSSALPRVEPEREHPWIYAIPGNHDWYDGLSAFAKFFCTGRWIGGWKTNQQRSYFALKLPNDWCIWGLDVQTGSDIDRTQIEYFKNAAGELGPGHRVIVCVAEPLWIYSSLRGATKETSVDFLERTIVNPTGATIPLFLSGDLHHFAWYTNEADNDQTHYVTCGGGGAFLHETHSLPDDLTVVHGSERRSLRSDYALKQRFPDQRQSKKALFGNLLFPLKNPFFSAILGAYYLLLVWSFQGAPTRNEYTFLERLARPFDSYLDPLKIAFDSTAFNLPAIILIFAGIFGSVAFAKPNEMPSERSRLFRKWIVGTLHVTAHLIVVSVLSFMFSRINLNYLAQLPFLDEHVSSFSQITLMAAELIVLGGTVGGFIFGAYLLVSNLLLSFHQNEASSSLRIENYKSFIRFRLTKESLTAYVLAIDSFPQSWNVEDRRETDPWFEPGGSLEPRLLTQFSIPVLR